VVRQQPRHALQKTRIVIDYDHVRRLRHHIRVQSRGVRGPSGGRPILDLDQWNLDRHEPHDERIVACRGTRVGQGADAGWCGLRMCTSVDGTFETCRLHRAMSEFEVQSGKHMLALSSSQFGRVEMWRGGIR
jgi:hypothetical protein